MVVTHPPPLEKFYARPRFFVLAHLWAWKLDVVTWLLSVGLKVGAAVVGSIVGATVQFAVKIVGVAEGLLLGGSDGADEGIGVESMVGVADGELVGWLGSNRWRPCRRRRRYPCHSCIILISPHSLLS